ncbi:MAG: hypothetical protein CENE_01666 [Candidatus Celerinatantimonas neptuna]|nr:MAG: hypothetical protein CENE_01666 [Candidatus Celerinatantimonas neptuna]
MLSLYFVGFGYFKCDDAPRIQRVNRRLVAISGFSSAMLSMLGASFFHSYGALLVWHILAGLSVGAALSMVHGTIALSQNPHRLFAYAGTALGIFAVIFLGVTPHIIAASSGEALFAIFALVMGIAALVYLLPSRIQLSSFCML